jgi:putative DNA primase/helicase
MSTPSKYSNEQLSQWKREINAIPIVASRVSGQREGAEFVANCPFHQEKTPSFKVYRGDDGVWLFKCFGCQANGNVFQFVERFDKISFTEAVQNVLEQGGTIDPAAVDVQPRKKPDVTFPASHFVAAQRALEESTAGQKWLADRGITMETARRFHLGFMQDASPICGPAKATWNHPWRDKGWILFPTLTDDDTVVCAIKLRSLVSKKETIDGKVVFGIVRAKNTATMLFNLREVNDLEDVFVVEGEPDTLVIAQTSGTPVVGLPSSGYKISAAESEVLKMAKRRFLAGDNTVDGIKAMDRLWKDFGRNTFMIRWPDGVKDANDALLQMGEEKFVGVLDDLKQEAVNRGTWKELTKKEADAPAAAAEIVTHTADTVTPKRLKWLWPDRVTSNKITLYAGNPDNGKSLAAIDLAAHVTTGMNFPDCQNSLPPSEVLMLLGEDDEDDTAVPRLMAAGANLKKIHFPEGVSRPNVSEGSEVRLDIDLPALESVLDKHPAIRLLVIDPISSYLGDVNMIAEQSVRSVLTPLRLMAMRHNVAVLFVMHLNKKSELDAISRVGGAMAFIGVARSAWLFIRDESTEDGEQKDSFTMCRMKSNLTASKGGGIAYSVKQKPIALPDEPESVWVPHVVWGEKINKSADDSLGRTASKREGSGRPPDVEHGLEAATHWLSTFLTGGPRWSKDVFERAREEKAITRATLLRAQIALGVEPHKQGKKWMWALTPMNAKAAAEPQDERDETEAEPTASVHLPDGAVGRAFELK